MEVTLNLYHVQFFKGLVHLAHRSPFFSTFSGADQRLIQLERNMINSLMCVCMPRECVWLERWALPSIEEVLRLPALQKAVLMDSSHNLAKAKVRSVQEALGDHVLSSLLQRLWFEGDMRKSKKNIVHGLRYLHYGTCTV